jgi:2-iminobutanoate/2-iminopropanoate deaminase
MKKEIKTQNAPQAIGPYSQAVEINNMVFVAGQCPFNHVTGEVVTEITAATRLVLTNAQAILAAAGLTLNSVVKTTVFLKDLNDFAKMNEVYQTFFTAPYPARSTVEVSKLPKDSVVEIECIAFR